jgi:hypothetical protein
MLERYSLRGRLRAWRSARGDTLPWVGHHCSHESLAGADPRQGVERASAAAAADKEARDPRTLGAAQARGRDQKDDVVGRAKRAEELPQRAKRDNQRRVRQTASRDPLLISRRRSVFTKRIREADALKNSRKRAPA